MIIHKIRYIYSLMDSYLEILTAKNLLEGIKFVGIWGTLIPMLIGFYNIDNLKTSQTIILVYLCISIFTDLFVNILAAQYLQNNMITFNLFGIIEFINLILFFYCIIKSEKVRLIIKLLFFPVLLFAILNYTIGEGVYHFNNLTFLLTSSIFILLILLYMVEIVYKIEKIRIEREPDFWLSSGLLLFFSINFFLLNFFGEVNLGNKYSWLFYPSRIIMNCFVIYGFICQLTRITSNTPLR